MTGRGGGGLIPPRIVGAFALVVLALIVVVVAVGLIRDNLDSTAVVGVLATMFSGVVVGGLLKGSNDDKGGGDPP